jgi:hypothetical protein
MNILHNKPNEKYRDSVFTLLLSEKPRLIELYNAIEGTNYSENTPLEITTLENALYMNRKNDISFTIEDRFVILLEHQTSINPNMPLRFLLYIARVYEKLIDSWRGFTRVQPPYENNEVVDNKKIYKEHLIEILNPEFIVLYNGTKDFPEEKILKLSDAFLEKNCSD